MIITEIGTLTSLGCTGRVVLLRLDLNSPIDPTSHQILDDKRFREHIPTIDALNNNRVVIITHQSRPGKKDFTTLEMHARKLELLLHRPVSYVNDIFGRCARESIAAMQDGDVLMLENVRFNAEENLTLPAEEAAKTHLVRNLSGMADFFVNDAFGTAHRSQPTVVGLPMVMRSAAGLLMEKEVSTLSRVFHGPPPPVVMVLGGTKVDDSIDVALHVLDNGIADKVVVIGVVANVFLAAAGHSIGNPSLQLIQQLKYTEQIEIAKDLLSRFADRIVLPTHVAVREEGKRVEYPVTAIPTETPIMDLGLEAITALSAEIGSAGTVVFNGPAGVFEEPDFAIGTQALLKATASVEFSVCGGGHTGAVIEKMGLGGQFTHISTGGGACIEFLTGKVLPAVDALRVSKERFG